jgi:TetR/AcrR family transcriptional repressor of nem operon
MAQQENKPLPHRERLLRQGMRHFYANGFHGTTVDAVLAAADVPKGSFYHHFGSKEAFGQAVLDRYFEFQATLLRRWAGAAELSTVDRLAGYLGEMTTLFVGSDYRRACLAGKFATEVAPANDAFRAQLAGYLRGWTSDLAELLRAGQERGDTRADRTAEELAGAVLALIQGAFVVALANRDEQALHAAGETIALLVSPA